ncbi:MULTISPECIES: EI24 domain-containing protein [Roseobacteraceae]|uniref:CysZ-like protein n=1 Tax=Pseudosulfitobacter pseudonitzschiae TaxID=1402135 RepID=A0A221JVV8_9RHOB|nr:MULTISPECIES: EI24 domain-containing protein [Roseobacteraceae]ASM70881.1 CysZ-like protein [Pseudosulfitobacter pseudonitzschiae]
MIFASFFAALGQIGDPRFRRVLLLGVVLTIALLVAFTTGLVWLIDALTADSVDAPIVGEITWLDDILSWGSVFLMLVLSVFLMVPVASAITSMFLDEVAQAVEDEHYPNLPPAINVPFGDAVRDTVNFLGVLIGANLLAIIVYVILTLMLMPFLTPLVFWALNGFLLGREYFTLAAMRRVGREQARVLRSQHRMTIFFAGFLMAIPLSVPLVNLLIPILGAATFTHLFHRLQMAGPSGRTSQYRAN